MLGLQNKMESQNSNLINEIRKLNKIFDRLKSDILITGNANTWLHENERRNQERPN